VGEVGKLILEGAAGALIEIVILVVTGVVLLDRVKNLTRDLKARVDALEDWRDGHISSTQPHAVCILEDRRKIDEHERLERIERKIDRLEERINALTEKIHERN
jgi:hypothetical protein